MTTRRDWQLQQLGITQWTLRRPAVLQGEVAVKLPSDIRLLLVADPLPPMDHPLVADVARSMALTSAQLYGVTPDQVMMLPDSVRCHCWWLGLNATRDFAGISFHTPPLAALAQDAGAKRELWRRISDDEHHITAAAG
ncbi:DNA polymerase III subunit psi [Candidatus Sodalis endolongispinus]|uniref:DNA polymerase III subunit psi n=1 Tax=Candidatus Sodalis endolongispinus TaxID=2812662 RepID=A0ABS5YCL1_9GAMM|nr:DNA polymerase III subunit psi [Candidatus Sodalis endolongispinus]MBT9432452.1 DNA polymerase III subunit psi [Candidatus Sodalis endolongispinus]